MENFDSAKLLLARAVAHIREFDAWVNAYLTAKESPGEFFSEYDSSTDETLHKWRVVRLPPDGLAAVAFDAINCLRSSLDHAVYDAAAVLNSDPSPKYTKFPFGEDIAGATRDLQRKRAEVPEGLWPFLLRYKPYKPENGGNEALYGFNEVRNGKIHRILSVMASQAQGTKFGNFIAPAGGAKLRTDWNADDLEYTYLITQGRTEEEYDFQILLNVCFGQTTPFAGKPAGAVLKQFFGTCDAIVRGIEGETARLKAGGFSP